MKRNNVLSNKEEKEIVEKRLPYIHKLLQSTKITNSEKLSVLEDVNIDVAAFLESIGEEI